MTETKQTLVIPTVHKGGTSREDLLDARRKFSDALYEAGRALGNMFPHSRDYREALGGRCLVPSFSEAVDQHTRRASIFLDLQLEIDAEREAIYNS